MNAPTPQPDTAVPAEATMPNPLSCFGGSIVAGGITFVLYNMTSAIALSFARKIIHTDNITTQRIAAAVRTLVVGLSALGTGIFGLAALGLLGLGIQLFLKGKDGSGKNDSSKNDSSKNDTTASKR